MNDILIFLKKLSDRIKTINCREWFKAISGFVTFFASIATIFGVILIVPQLKLTNQQLKELNAKANIDIKLNLATSTLSVGPSRSEPLNLFVAVYNSGDHNPTFWRAMLLFCNGIEVIKADGRWKGGDQYWYFLDSQKPLIPHLMIFATVLDEVGAFTITLPTENNRNLDSAIPVAIVYASGEKNVSKAQLVSFSKTKFIYDDVKVQNGGILSDLRGCKDVETVN